MDYEFYDSLFFTGYICCVLFIYCNYAYFIFFSLYLVNDYKQELNCVIMYIGLLLERRRFYVWTFTSFKFV